MTGRRRWAALLVALVALLAGCTRPAPPTTTAPSPATPSPRPFTAVTTEPVTVMDPVAATDDASIWFSYQVFQRLMTAEPGESLLKPDAAQDCLFKSETVYECRLPEDLRFHTGGRLTSSDVRFSILRALRLGTDRTAVSALGALDRIETPTFDVVRFVLKWPDTQFGFALAAPCFSIVNEQIYNPDAIRATDQLPSGSGPFQLITRQDDYLLFGGYGEYKGPTPPQLPQAKVLYAKDSAAIEDAMSTNTVDYVWRGLGEAAVRRLTTQSKNNNGRTQSGFGPVFLTGTRVQKVGWNPASATVLDASLRTAVAGALQDGRTLDSLLPPTVPGHVASFQLGGSASMPPLTGQRPRLTLGFNSHAPDQATLARDIRDQIEARAAVSVQLLPDDMNADLRLFDTRPWVNTPLAWLMPYVATAPPGSAAKVAELDQRWRTTTDKTVRETALAEIQKQAAADLVVLPVSQDDEVAWVANGYSLTEPRFGPGFQFALWSVKKG